ncbi:MAG TPA: ATP-binding protein [Candidatus Polarisedimenticolaceae bacterium]|nr:ATP-binding protein [Candidatus Polarisedimenticolaceae bacterium]
MRRSTLSVVLIALNVSLALLAVSGLAAAAAALLRRFSDQQSLDRVQIAAASAERNVEREGEALAAAVRLLAGQPFLTAAWLERVRADAGLTACAVFRAGREVASAGSGGLALDAPAGDTSSPWRIATAPSGELALIASAPLSADPASSVAAAKLLDDAFARKLGEAVGAVVHLADVSRGVGDLGDPKLPLRARLLHDVPPAAARLDAIGAYATVRALRAPDGRVAGFLEVDIPARLAQQARLRLVRRLMILAVAIGGIAALATVLVVRGITAPLERLSEAADRIGGGDLTTPVGESGFAELGRLGASMEGMRRRLRRLAADLEEQRSEARAMINGIVEGVFVVDGERRVVQMNPQTASMLGIDPSAAIGRFCGDVLNPEGPGGVRPCEDACPILNARFRGEARATERLVLPDGTRRTVVVTSSTSGTGRQFQVVRDETEVEAARRLRDAVLANISHEFKTPLAAQIASLELLLDRLPDLGPEETRRLIVSLQRGAMRLTQLIDNLLESVRIEAGRAGLRRRPVHLDELVEEAVEMIRPLADQRGQTIEIALPHPLPTVSGDAPRLVQVLVNLLANAAKFSPDGGTIRVGASSAPGGVTLWVEDEGPGWSDEDAPHLFDPFVRSTEDEPESSGVGLGLYIAKSIVERHGGTLDARTGSGRTRVAMTIPTTEAAA